MKRIYYGVLFCLSACSTAPTASKEQQAISDHLKAGANDPASYQAVRWGNPLPYRQADLDSATASTYIERLAKAEEALSDSRADYKEAVERPFTAATIAMHKADIERFTSERDNIREQGRALLAKVDTTVVGTRLKHA